jgi:RNA polymerase sigma-70 factor (ECF subfamily)
MDDRRPTAGRDCEHAVSRPRPASPERTSAEFHRLRPYLLRVAYSHLGSLSEAEDLVQEAWLRLTRADLAEVRDLRAWLTTVVSRLALDALTTARARREQYVGPWLPEPVVQEADDSADPAHRADLDEDVSMAMLIVLESLSPAERSAFLLHDVFGYTFDEVAHIVDRTPAPTRTRAARPRAAVKARRPRYPAPAEKQRELVQAFLGAAQDGDIASLLGLLDPSVTYRSDGGGLVPASRTVFTGDERVARIFTAMSGHYGELYIGSVITVNGAPGLLLKIGDDRSVVAVTTDGGRITSLDVMRNPEKLTTLARGISTPRSPE